MANTNPTPNMNLPVPVVGVDFGPDWANQINGCFSILDGHNHSVGSGVQINPSGININTDLPFNSTNATLLRSVRFIPQVSPLAGITDLGCLYESGVDLYYNDGNGNQVRITQSGGVSGTPGSIANLTSPASATYVAANETFVFQSAASTAANIDGGAFIFRNITANSNGITVQAPASLGSNYTITLPALPAQTNVMTIDSSGNEGSVTFDQVGVNMTATGADAIAVTMGATGANTIANNRTRAVGATVGLGGVALSPSCGVFNTSNTFYTSVTNLSVNITTSGRPVFVGTIDDGLNSLDLSAYLIGTSSNDMVISLDRSSTQLSQSLIAYPGGAPGEIFTVDFVGAGTWNYSMVVKSSNGGLVGVQSMRLVAYEL
jgi:hypothetical protein